MEEGHEFPGALNRFAPRGAFARGQPRPVQPRRSAASAFSGQVPIGSFADKSGGALPAQILRAVGCRN
eukprot:8801387-Lingulodinium_polyedra.AAC.1